MGSEKMRKGEVKLQELFIFICFMLRMLVVVIVVNKWQHCLQKMIFGRYHLKILL